MATEETSGCGPTYGSEKPPYVPYSRLSSRTSVTRKPGSLNAGASAARDGALSVADSRPLASSTEKHRQISMLKDLLRDLRPSDKEDAVKWRWTPNQLFTVKSLYQFITDDGLRVPTYLHIWKLNITVKIKVFIWLLLRKRLPTVDRLLIPGIDVDQNCAFCAVLTECYDHLFNDCVYVRYLLLCTGGVDANNDNSADARGLWALTTAIPVESTRKHRLIVMAATWWVIWTD